MSWNKSSNEDIYIYIYIYIYSLYYEYLLPLFSIWHKQNFVNEARWCSHGGDGEDSGLFVCYSVLIGKLPTFRKKRLQVCNPHGVTFHKTWNLHLLETSFERYAFHGSHRWINSRTLNHLLRLKIIWLQNYLITKYSWQRILKTCVPNSTMTQHILWHPSIWIKWR